MTTIKIENLVVQRQKNKILTIEKLILEGKGAVALIGPNGSGKSTLLKTMAGIESFEEGEITLNQKAIQRLKGYERAQTIGFIPQSFTPHWDQTVEELLTLAGVRVAATLLEQEAVMTQFELSSLYESHWHALSGGERARVVSAMALIGHPPIIFADEPGAALDVKHRLKIVKDLVSRGEENLVVACLHELDLVFRFFKKVILLCKGEILFFGAAEDLLHQNLLDIVFDVDFQRVKIEDGYLLNAKE